MTDELHRLRMALTQIVELAATLWTPTTMSGRAFGEIMKIARAALEEVKP